MRTWFVLLALLLFPFDGGTEENKDILPPPATLDGKEGESLTDLLYKRDNTIDEWDTEELKHLQTIKKIFEEPLNVPKQPSIIAEYKDKNYMGPRDTSSPVTLGELVSSGVGMLVNHRISDVKKTKQNKNNKIIVKSEQNEDIMEALHMVSSSSSDDDSGDDEDDGISSSFVLFLIALFPALIGLLILGTFIVLLFLEIVHRTRPALPDPLQYGGYAVDDTEEGAIYEDFLPQDYEQVMEPVVRNPSRNVRGKRITNNNRRTIRIKKRYGNRARPYYG